MYRLKHYDNLGTIRFITFSCYQRLPFLQDDSSCLLFLRVLDGMRKAEKFKLHGYVIMPNHVHLVILPKDDTKVGLLIGRLKGLVSHELMPEVRKDDMVKDITSDKLVFWHKRCYDHNCRTIEIVREKIVYCHNNPVLSSFVGDAGQWKWSSYNWYHGRRDVPIEIDNFEL